MPKTQTGFPLSFDIVIQVLFKDPQISFSRTNSQWKFTAWAVELDNNNVLLQTIYVIVNSRTFKELCNET